MKALFWLIAIVLVLGLAGGASQGNLPFQNGNGWQGAPQSPAPGGG